MKILPAQTIKVSLEYFSIPLQNDEEVFLYNGHALLVDGVYAKGDVREAR